MKIVTQREQLLSAFQTAATVAPGRSPKPILQNVKLIATPDGLVLMATDMEVGIRIELSGPHVEVPGDALLSVAQFGSILRESTDAELTIESDGRGVTVRSERSVFRLSSGNPLEFPDVPGFAATDHYVVSARLMKELIRRTLFATDNESGRYAFGGVLLEFESDRITAVGTDGRRLAKMEGASSLEGNPSMGDVMTIVPARSMQLIERSLTDLDSAVHLAVQGNDFLIRSQLATVITRLLEGRFPRWRDVLPIRKQAIDIDLTVGPLLSAIRQASIVTSSESRGIDFTFGNGLLVLSGLTADIGESRVELPIAYDGDPITLCLDFRFVLDFLRVLDSERIVRLNILNAEAAALFETDDGYGYVVMPLARERPARTSSPPAGADG